MRAQRVAPQLRPSPPSASPADPKVTPRRAAKGDRVGPRMKRFLLLAAVISVLGSILASPAAASTGSITNAVASPDWTHGSVANLSVTFDECGAADAARYCPWQVKALLTSPAVGPCPTDDISVLDDINSIWGHFGTYTLVPSTHPPGFYDWAFSNGSLESGPLTFSLNDIAHTGQPFDEVCLYIIRDVSSPTGCLDWRLCGSLPVAELLADQPLVVQAAPTPTTLKHRCPKGKRAVRHHGKTRCVRRHRKHRHRR
jgi:hypothetical protein